MNRDGNFCPDEIIEKRNLEMQDMVSEKAAQINGLAKSMRWALADDRNNVDRLTDMMTQSDSYMSQGMRYVSSVTEDPTAMGVFRIAMLVFTALTTTYFGAKGLFRLFR